MLLIFKIIQPQKIKKYLLILMIIFIISVGLSILTNYIYKEINSKTINNKNNRTYVIRKLDNYNRYEDLKKVEIIKKIYYYNSFPLIGIYTDNNQEISVNILYFNHLIALDNSNHLDYNEIAVSKKFLKNYSLTIGTKISINIDGILHEFIIADSYNNKNMDDLTIYLSSENDLNNENISQGNYIVLLDQYSNYKLLEDNIKDINCTIELVNDSNIRDATVYQDIFLFLKFFIIITYTSLLLIFIFLQVSIILEKKYAIALLKIFGYKNYLIAFIFTIYFLTISLFLYFPIILISIIIIFAFKLSFLFFNILILNLLIIVILNILLLLITFNIIKKFNIINLLKK